MITGEERKLENGTNNEMLPSFVLGGTRVACYVLDIACSLLYSSYPSSPLFHFCFSPTQPPVVHSEYL